MTKRFGFAFLLFLAALARADFNFMVQGRLSDGEGNPIGVQTAVEWRLFRGGDPAIEDGDPVYRETGFIIPVNSLGVFSYELGSGIPLDDPLDVSAYAGSQPIYALLVVGNSPLLPKLRVTPVPRSHVAAVAESVQADGVDTPALKNAAVTGPKIADGAISGNHLNPSAQLNVDRIGLGGAPATSLDLGAKTDAVRLPLGTIAQRPAAPANGDTRYNSETNSLESYVNGAWQSLSTNAGTVTTVTASTPLASTGGTTPVLSIPQADGATGGYLASADWTTFNAKLAPALTAGQIFVGNDSNTATGQPLSGDATLSSAGALTLASTGTAGTYTKVTTDAKGRVTAGAALDAADIPNLDAAKINSGTIDPARIPAGTDSGKLPLAGGTMSGAIAMGGNNITNAGSLGAGSATVTGSVTAGSVVANTGITAASATVVGALTTDSLAAATSATVGGHTVLTTTSTLDASLISGDIAGNAANVAGTVAITHGGTGAVDAPTARANLSAAVSGANADITSLAGLTTPLSVPQGGIGSTTTTKNYMFAAPDNADGAPSFRALVSTDIPNLDASKTNSGTFDTARIPDLDAAKITSGTIDPARIPAGSNGSDRLPLAGGTMTGAIDMAGYNITNAATVAASSVTVGGNPVVVAPAPLTSGSVLFATGASSAGQDNSNLFWDNTNKRLGIGTVTPSSKFEVVGGNISLNTNGQSRLFSTYFGANSVGENLFLGGGGQSSVGAPGETFKGAYNTSVGVKALYSNTSGYNNTAQGREALYFNTTGYGNTANGLNALSYNTTGSENTANGRSALYYNTTGSENTANGAGALYYNTGSQNTAHGVSALYYNTTGSQNAALGLRSGRNPSNDIAQYRITTDTNMTLLGYGATKDNAAELTNGTAIGFDAHVLASNQVVLGNDAVTTTLLKGNVGVGTTSPAAKLHLSSGTATANTAPLKFTAGTNLTTPEAGAVEFDGTDLYFSTNTTTRKTFAFQGSAGTLSGLTSGSVLFATGTASAGQDNSNLFWDNTNKRLGIGTATPSSIFNTVKSDAGNVFSALNTANIRVGNNVFAGGFAGIGFFGYLGLTPLGAIGTISNDGGGIGAGDMVFGVKVNNVASDVTEYMRIKKGGNVGVGTTSPTAKLHLSSGTASANTAPLKFTAGTNLTTPEAGAVEFDGTDLYFSTDSTTRKTFAFQGSAGTLSGLTAGSVLFANGASSAGQDNSNLFWDNTNKRLGVGTASPYGSFHVKKIVTSPVSPRDSAAIYFGETGLTGNVFGWLGVDQAGNGSASFGVRKWGIGYGNLLLVPDGGNVGIGTTTASGKLDVNQTTAGSVAIQAQNAGTVLWKVVNPAGGITGGYNAADAVEYVAKDSVTERSINAAGTINASGADFAEWVDWDGPQPEMGSIVKYRGAYVVVSSPGTAAFVGNDVKDPRHAILVAFAGQLPVWVKGPVREGDLIVANGDGTGRAIARDAATLADEQKAVGTAWASSENSGLKRINVAVGIGLNGGSQDVESLKAKDLAKDEKIKRLEQENTEIKERLDQIEKTIAKSK